LTSLSEKKNTKLDKSYALVEFESSESKAKALIPELRVFGFKFGSSMVTMDDADYKVTLLCNNVHWGANLKNFTSHLNEVFAQKNSHGIYR
jgi:hypothetical protein